MTDNKKFKTQVKAKLAELDMSQVELAKELGINRKYLNQIITGNRKGTKQRIAIIQILKLHKEEFIE